jgi:hypothetical protein
MQVVVLLIKMKLVWVIIASNVRPHVFQILTTFCLCTSITVCCSCHSGSVFNNSQTTSKKCIPSNTQTTSKKCIPSNSSQTSSAFPPIVHKQEVHSTHSPLPSGNSAYELAIANRVYTLLIVIVLLLPTYLWRLTLRQLA